MSRVKIVATIGPRTNDAETLKAMWEAGMGVARLNGSHGKLDWHRDALALIRQNVPAIPVLLDVPGRKIRTRRREHALKFSAGDKVVLTANAVTAEPSSVMVDYPTLHEDVDIGDEILIDDGRLHLTVTEVAGPDVVCRAGNGGMLVDAKGVNVPRLKPRSDFLSARDRDLVNFAMRHDVDFIGLSYVESAADVRAVRALIGDRAPKIVSKIETQGALDNLSEIMAVSDALMVDRGDLSVETNLETVALSQKRVLLEARGAATPVIVATEILHSMIDSPWPTKAEVSDITTAVLDHAAALMLSGETAMGAFPVEAVATMRRVADTASDFLQDSMDQGSGAGIDHVPEAMGEAIALICRRLDVTKIVAITISGYAAVMVSARTPRQPIIAVTNDPGAARRFNLLPGTRGFYVDVPFSRSSLDHIPRCLELLWHQGELVDEDLILVTAVGYPKSGNRMNLIETHRVADLRDTLGWKRSRD